MRNIGKQVISLIIMAAVSAPVVGAQQGAVRAPLLLAVSATTLPEGVRAMLVRTAAGAQQDLVVLAPDANAVHTLAGAVALLQYLRAEEPVARSTQVHYVTLAVSERSISAQLRTKYTAMLQKARAGERREIIGIGAVSVIASAP